MRSEYGRKRHTVAVHITRPNKALAAKRSFRGIRKLFSIYRPE